jgi:hypothetical protein
MPAAVWAHRPGRPRATALNRSGRGPEGGCFRVKTIALDSARRSRGQRSAMMALEGIGKSYRQFLPGGVSRRSAFALDISNQTDRAKGEFACRGNIRHTAALRQHLGGHELGLTPSVGGALVS